MNKTDNAYKSIGEVAKILNLINKKNGNLNTHTIRFWEKEFKQIKPKIFYGKRRYYDDNAINLLKKIKLHKISLPNKFNSFYGSHDELKQRYNLDFKTILKKARAKVQLDWQKQTLLNNYFFSH